jgi:thiamine-monophosphate kinase
MTTVRDLGEFGLIERLTKKVAEARLTPPSAGDFQLRLGIGDDAAAWRVGHGVEVSTTDTLVEGAHFTRQTIPWPDVGWKLMAANLSDIAAMGATPLYATITLGLPSNLPVADVDRLYDGILQACSRYATMVVGGDVVSAPIVFVSATLNGVTAAEPLTRTAARPGDAVAITGPLGASAGGLRLLQRIRPGPGGPDSALDGVSGALIDAHRRPEPRLQEGQRLLRAGIRCAMDVSDGLVADLSKLCHASGVAAQVREDRVPVDANLQKVLPEEALQLALNGGEEYELLFTGPPAILQRVTAELPHSAIIGEVTAEEPGQVLVLDSTGDQVQVTASGWDHLR